MLLILMFFITLFDKKNYSFDKIKKKNKAKCVPFIYLFKYSNRPFLIQFFNLNEFSIENTT